MRPGQACNHHFCFITTLTRSSCPNGFEQQLWREDESRQLGCQYCQSSLRQIRRCPTELRSYCTTHTFCFLGRVRHRSAGRRTIKDKDATTWGGLVGTELSTFSSRIKFRGHRGFDYHYHHISHIIPSLIFPERSLRMRMGTELTVTPVSLGTTQS